MGLAASLIAMAAGAGLAWGAGSSHDAVDAGAALMVAGAAALLARLVAWSR